MTRDISLLQQFVVYAIWLAVVFGAAEWLRGRQVDGELVRKVIHIGVGNIIIACWVCGIPRLWAVGISAIASVVALISQQFGILESLNGVDRQSYGTFFYATSIALLFALFWHPGLEVYAVIGVLVMTWGDAIAALVGKTWGKHPFTILGNTKSWEGSLAMWGMSSLVIGLAIAADQIWGAGTLAGGVLTVVTVLVLGAIATGLELFSWKGLDNITVPVASAALAYGVFQLGWLNVTL